ncbi:UNVERIFIED_CONTAM: hypothetical protein HDU68_002981 [Siphonaria sp. JEL0065]|nr:hypothetical protein HDU68_002981 [Siphonaria sp. JEL0065]
MIAKHEKKELKHSRSLSSASELEMPTILGLFTSGVDGYMKTEVFKKTSGRSLLVNPQYLGDESKSAHSRKSNASGLSSGLSSLRRSLSSSKNFRKKQVHYHDSTNQMGYSTDSKDFEVIDKNLILKDDAYILSSSDGDVELLSRRSSGISLRVPSMKGSQKSSRQGTMRGKTGLHQESNFMRNEFSSADGAIGD